MGGWDCTGLGCGFASAVLLAYFLFLKSRLCQAREELAALEKDRGRRTR